MASTFTVRWGFQCAECGEAVKVGDEATFTATGDKIHFACPTTDSEIIGKRPDNLCPRCNTTRPCFCD